MTPTLYEYSVCPFCCKVKALLLYKKIPFHAVEVHPMSKNEIKFSKEYKKVPIFVDGSGQQINDSTPIMQHIESLYADTPVFEQNDTEAHWLKWADETLVKSMPPYLYNTLRNSWNAFRYITKSPTFSLWQKFYIQSAGAFVMYMVAKKKAKKQEVKCPKEHFSQCIKEWEGALGAKQYLGGTSPNGADIAVFGILRSIQDLSAFDVIEANPKVHQWYQAIRSQTEKI